MFNADLFEPSPQPARLLSLREFAAAVGRPYGAIARAVASGQHDWPLVRVGKRRYVPAAYLQRITTP